MITIITIIFTIIIVIVIPKEGQDIGLTIIVINYILITIAITFAKNHHDYRFSSFLLLVIVIETPTFWF